MELTLPADWRLLAAWGVQGRRGTAKDNSQVSTCHRGRDTARGHTSWGPAEHQSSTAPGSCWGNRCSSLPRRLLWPCSLYSAFSGSPGPTPSPNSTTPVCNSASPRNLKKIYHCRTTQPSCLCGAVVHLGFKAASATPPISILSPKSKPIMTTVGGPQNRTWRPAGAPSSPLLWLLTPAAGSLSKPGRQGLALSPSRLSVRLTGRCHPCPV